MSTPQQSVGASLIRRLSARGAIMGQVLSFCLLMLPIVGYSMWAEWNFTGPVPVDGNVAVVAQIVAFTDDQLMELLMKAEKAS